MLIEFQYLISLKFYTAFLKTRALNVKKSSKNKNKKKRLVCDYYKV